MRVGEWMVEAAYARRPVSCKQITTKEHELGQQRGKVQRTEAQGYSGYVVVRVC